MALSRALAATVALLYTATAEAFPKDWDALIADVRLGYGQDIGGSNFLDGANPGHSVWWQAPSIHGGIGLYAPLAWEHTFFRTDLQASWTPRRKTGLRVRGAGPMWADTYDVGPATERIVPRYESFSAEWSLLFGRRFEVDEWQLFPAVGLLVAVPHDFLGVPLFAWDTLDGWEGVNPIEHGDRYELSAHGDMWGLMVDLETHWSGWIELRARAGWALIGPFIARAIHMGNESYVWSTGYTTFGVNTVSLRGASYTVFSGEARLGVLEQVAPFLRYQGDRFSFASYTPNALGNDKRTRYVHHRLEAGVLFRFGAVTGS